MLTLKFHHTINDYWEVYETSSYKVEHIQLSRDPAPGEIALREVHFDCNSVGEVQLLSMDDEHWDVCYVVNNVGNTVDRIHAPDAAPGTIGVKLGGNNG